MNLVTFQYLKQFLNMFSRDHLDNADIAIVVKFGNHEITCDPFKEYSSEENGKVFKEPRAYDVSESFDNFTFFKVMKDFYSSFVSNNWNKCKESIEQFDQDKKLIVLDELARKAINVFQKYNDDLVTVPTDYLINVKYMDNYASGKIQYIHLNENEKQDDVFKYICLINK